MIVRSFKQLCYMDGKKHLLIIEKSTLNQEKVEQLFRLCDSNTTCIISDLKTLENHQQSAHLVPILQTLYCFVTDALNPEKAQACLLLRLTRKTLYVRACKYKTVLANRRACLRHQCRKKLP